MEETTGDPHTTPIEGSVENEHIACTKDDAAHLQPPVHHGGLPSDLVEDRARRMQAVAPQSVPFWGQLGIEDLSTFQMSAAAGFCIVLLGWQQLLAFALLWAGVAWYRNGYIPPREVFIGVIAGAAFYSILASGLGLRSNHNEPLHHFHPINTPGEWRCQIEGNEFVCRMGPHQSASAPPQMNNYRQRQQRQQFRSPPQRKRV